MVYFGGDAILGWQAIVAGCQVMQLVCVGETAQMQAATVSARERATDRCYVDVYARMYCGRMCKCSNASDNGSRT